MGVEQYVDRTIDVLAFRGVRADARAVLDQSLADESSTGEICTGVQKLAQRFLLALLTEQGTVKHAPDYGTTFMTEIRQGSIQTDAELRSLFDLSAQHVGLQLVAEESDDDPPDEKFKKAELIGVSLSSGYASLTIRLYAEAETLDFILPIEIVV